VASELAESLAERVETGNVRLAPTFIGMTAFLPVVAVPSGASAPLLAGERIAADRRRGLS